MPAWDRADRLFSERRCRRLGAIGMRACDPRKAGVGQMCERMSLLCNGWAAQSYRPPLIYSSALTHNVGRRTLPMGAYDNARCADQQCLSIRTQSWYGLF